MINYVDPFSKDVLILDREKKEFISKDGSVFKVVNNIPRFVKDEAYAGAFGFQWRKFRKTQLDSHTGTNITETRLKGICKEDLSIFSGQNVLEVGSGAGRFSEILLKYGAKLHSTDLSSAVEANFLNFNGNNNYKICQADLRHIPYPEECFDIVICLGVVQHTPNPEETIAELSKYVRKGGILLIDHYTNNVDKKDQKKYNIFIPKLILRLILLRTPSWLSIRICYALTWFLWPLHKILFRLRKIFLFRQLYKYLPLISPVHDYQSIYPQLSKKLIFEWAVLDTHDACTDRYKHLRSVKDIEHTLSLFKFSKIDVWYGGNGVEAMAIK